MSTDFSLHALLNGSTSSTSVTSTNSSDRESTSSPSQLDLNSQRTLSSVPGGHAPVSDAKRTKRKREDSDNEKENRERGLEPAKKKRVRTAFTREQLQRLEFAFAQNQYPDMLMRQNIAEELGLPDQKIHVWFQNRRAKLRRLRGQPTAVFPPPAMYPPLPQPPLKLPQQSTTAPAVYLNHQLPPQQLTHQSVGVQTQRFSSLSPSPSPIHHRVQERRSLSSTPSVSPLSTPNGSPSMLKSVSPPQSGSAVGAVYPVASTCSIILPSARTSPPAALHLPVTGSANPPFPLAAPGQPFATPGQSFAAPGQSFAAPFPYYCSPQTSSAVSPSAPMYFVDMTQPLSGNRASHIIPPFPQVNIYQV